MNMNKIQKLLLMVICLFAVTATWGYDITVITNEANKTTNNGYLTTNVSTAGTSTLVTITAHPSDGYYVNTPVVTLVASGSSANAPRRAPGIGDTVTPTLVSANTYQFSMPNYDVEITATFTACTDIGSATVLLTEGTRDTGTGHYSQVYDFLTHSPKINSVTIGSTTLTEGTDYTVTGLGNFKNVNTYPITLTGIGKYKGTKTINYVISALSISTATINLSGNNFVYDHTQHKPTITHVYLNGQELTQDEDYYNVTYSDDTEGGSTNAGTYTITITGKGNFSGSCQATYTIAKKHISACTISTPSGTSFIYSGEEKELTVTITDGGYTLQQGSGKDYTLSGHKQTNVGAYTATITANELNYTGAASVNYTINANNDGYYIDVISDQTYTGSPIEPTVVVKKQADTTPKPTTDPVVGEGAYYLVFNNNINVGIATVNAVGKDGYSFMATQTFKIVAKSIENATITLSDFTTKKNNSTTNNCFMYNGSTQKPTVTVMDDTKQLLSGTDYILTNNGGVNAGNYTVTITGTGNYTGTLTSDSYSIEQKPLTGADITLSTSTFVYDGGNAKKPEVTLVKTTDGVVAYASDYDVTWTNYTNAGSSNSTDKPTVTVTAKSSGSNFTDFCSIYYTIEPKTITSDMVTLNSTASNWKNNSFTYTGSLQTPSVTVQYQYLPDATPTTPTTKTLTFGTDYNLTNDGGTEVGVYYATVVGTGNYKGTVNAPYSIVSDNDEEDIYITLAATTDYDYTYTGSPKKPGVTVKKGTGTSAITLDGTDNKDYELVYNNNVNAGQASVTVIGKGNYHFVKNQEFTIAKRDFSTDTGNKIQISLSSASFVYNGSKQRPIVTVTDTNAPTGSQVLTENKDYTLSEGNINVGTDYTVTITGMGNYTGAKTSATTYAITTLDMTTTNTIVTLEYNSTVYNRSEQKPKIERVTVNGIQLNEGDYSVTYPTSDYTNQGTKTIHFSGTGNFGGSKDVTYTIAQKPITSSMVTLSSSNQTTDPFVNNSFTYNGSVHVPVVTVKDGATTLTPSTTTDDNEYKLTNAGGTAVGVYYATVEGKGNYTGKVEVPYSIVSNNSDTGVSVTYAEDDDDIIYTGNPITLTLTVTKDNNPLTEGKNNDYEVVYNNNTNAGQATISVIGRNNYNFVKHIQFTIKKRPLTAAMVTLPGYTSDFVYNGNVQKPVVKVSYSSKDLIEGTDYKLTNNGITDVGDGYYKIEGDGNFTGTLESTDAGMPVYKITALSIVGAEISLIPLADPMYNGGEKKPSVQKITVTPVANGPSYVFTSGYTVSYENNTDVAVGTTQPTVKVTGGTNFGGTIATTTFTITPKPLADDMVVLTGVPTGGYTYDGSAKTPGATVTDNALLCENKVVPASNYTISYSDDIINPGDKVATITGQNNYTGYVDKPFVINPIGGSTDVTITLTDVPSGGYVYDGTPKTPTVTVTKGTGDSPTTLSGTTDYSVAYSDNINAGTATVTVTGIGNYDFTQTKTFSIAQKPMTDAMVALSGIPTGGYTYDATLKKPTVTVSDGTPSIITADDYTISNEGNINAGNYTVTVTASATGNYSGSGSQTYTIRPMSITTAEVALSYNNIVYNGVAQKPTIRSVYANGHLLTATTDYTITLPADADAINQGAKNVTVTGTGNYKDSRTVQYTIDKKPLASDMIKIANQNLTYTGSDQTPEVTIEDKNGTTNIIKSTDYTLSNPPHSAVGNYEVTLTATDEGNYSGQVTKQYSIVTAGSTGFTVVDIPDQNYTGIALTPALTVYKAGTTTPALELDTDYTAEYSNNINAGTATVTVTGKGNYSGTQTKTFTIVKRSLINDDITTTLTPSSFTYDGTPKRPTTVIVHDNLATINKDLKLGEDYTLEYKNTGTTDVDNLTSQGTKKVVITGIGNYSGTLEPTYTVELKSVADAEVALSYTTIVYNGDTQKPTVMSVIVDGHQLTENTDYTVDFTDISDYKNQGNKTFHITGKGNYSGTKALSYTIQKKAMTDNMITFNQDSFDYDGSNHAPTVTMVDLVGSTNIVNTNQTQDFTITIPTVSAVGTYTVSVEATTAGNYSGGGSKQFSIVPEGSVAFDVAWVTDPNFTYDGTAHEPAVKVTKHNTTTDLATTDYDIEYNNNINAGTNTASVTVTGKGNYSGSQTKTFSIAQKTMTNDMVALSGIPTGGYTYDATLKKPTVTVSDGTPSIITADDYTISNEGNINAGNYTVTVTASATGNYSGSGSQTYTIRPMSITTAEVALSYNNIVYNGVAQKPTIRSVYANGHLLTATTDYTITLPADADAINQGTKNVTVTGTGNYTDTRTVQYTIDKKPLVSDMIKITNQNLTYTGSDQSPEVNIEDYNGTTNIIKSADYTLSNPPHSAVGDYEVTLTATDAGNYSGQVTKQYSIVTAGSTGFTVEAIPAQDYTGLALTPALTVYKAGTTTPALTLGTDYTAEYSNNINAGTATVTVTGMGNYSGTQTVYFTITPKSLNATDITVTLSPASFSYTGTTQKPTVTVKDGTSKTLMLNMDYTLVNDGGIANGTYDVTITGIGNYKDVVTPTPKYTIGGQSLDDATVVLNRLDSYVYDGTAKTPGVSEVKVGSTVIPASNYTVSYTDNVNAGTATVTVTGTGNCSGSATATFDITPKTVNSDMITISPTTFNYDGNVHKPTTVTVMDGETTMVEGTTTTPKDYLLSNPGGTEIGAYSVTITGQKNYTGTASKSYTIVANDASGFSINAIADVTYNGTVQEPTPVVKEGDNTLSSNYYTVAYLNNINAGTAVVTVTGKNGYTFVKSQTFTIQPKSLEDDMLTLSATDFTYNGNVQKPTLTMTDLNGTNPIITSNDYVITNEGGTNVGTYHVVVNGQNNYKGSIDKTFTISQLSLSTASITLATLSNYVYDGAAKTPAVQLVKVGELVVPATAYNVAYNSNTNVGTATVSVTAKTGTNFKDGNTTTFSIEQKPVTSDMIYLSSENLEYTGNVLKPEVTVKDGNKTLALTTDYTLTNAGGTEVGSYEVTITGQGNYKGTAKKQYSIITKGSAGFSVDELTVPQTYTGMPLTPTVTVKKAGTTTILTLGTDYEVAYTDNINVGTATATITGKGNYSGTRSVNFTINPKPLTDGMVALSSTSFIYSGSEQKPVVSVTDTDNNMPLTQNTHYTVTYPTDAISQGTKTVTIRGIGNYTGEITKNYTIGMLSLDDASVTLNELTSYVYDGNEKKPTVKEVKVGTLVVPTTGYTVAYPDDIINIGKKTMTITGKGNYTGATTTSYTITPKTVNKEMILLSSENLIYTGSIIKPTVTVKDGSKTLTENTDYTLTNDGGKEVGTYSLTITGKGNYTGTASRTFNIITKGASVFNVSDIASVTYNGSEQEPDITVMDNSTTPATVLTKGTHYTVAYSNNKNVGSASVIVTGIGSYAGTVSKNFTITPKTLTGAMVTLSTSTFVFNSLAQKPEVTVEDKNAANVSIITDNDYTILNNGGINVGDNHEVKVTGKGNYTGTVTKTYAITPLSIADANVTLYQLQSYVYDGTAKKPGVREVMAGDITVPTTGYDVSYGENTNVGTATVTVTGKGNFKDAKTVDFTITGKPITSDMIVLSSENLVYNGEVQKPSVTVKEGTKTLTLGTDYALTNDGGTSVGTYSVTVAGMGNYASEASRSYSIVEKDGTTNFTISISNTSVQYNGSAQTPTVTVTDGTKTLTNNTDYEVAYTNHVNVGTATVTVTGKGNYAGTKTATFTITAKPLTETMVTLSATSFIYNTLIQKPEVSVSDGDMMTKDDYVITNNGGTNQGTYHVIVSGQCNYSGQIDKTFTITPLSIAEATVTLYQLQSYVYEGLQKKPGVRELTVGNINVPTQGYTTSYGDNVNAGTASVTVTGQGNFKDTKTVTFDIEPKAVENSMITLSNYEYTYNGEIQKPEVIVRDGETTLVLDTDYTLLNNGGKTVGSYDVIITGKGNYKGTASKSYVINTKKVGNFEVTLSAESVIYNGSEQQPEVTVKDGETVLTPGVNYTVAYTDNVDVGMATVTVRGLGEYDGSRNKTFLIKPKELSDAMVTLSTTTFTYNGLLQMPTVTVSDGTALTSNDYYITNEGGLNKGTYNVMVTGRNNYTGTVVRQYDINPMSINDAHVTLYQLQSYVYDGTEKNPGVREVAVGSHIVPSTSFTTTISPNVNVGTVTITVTGEKNYTGSASTTFEITPKPVTSGMITLTPDYFYYNGSVQKPAVSVKDGSKNMVENTDYTVTNNGGMEAGEYEVKVKGIGNYMDEASVKFTILSSGVNTFVVTLETSEYTFDGTEHKPNVTVKMEDRTLSEGTDYTLLYNNNVNAGTATVTVKGVGDYTGEQVKTFVIHPKTLTDAMVTLDKTSFIYNEKVQKPKVTVADGILMTEDDYTVTNEGGTEEGTYQIVVIGQNNYKGTVIKAFTITREEIHGDDDPEHPDEKPITYTPTEEGSDEVKVSGFEGTEEQLEHTTSVTIPTTFTSNGKTYTVVGISANAFANVPNLTDVYLPDTEEPLEIAEDAIPASVTVHTTLAQLDDYALMPSLSESFKAGKIMTTVTAKNRYWTFSSGVDVYVPDGVSVYIVRERDNAAVTIVELSDNDLTVGGQRIIKHNNGVLISSEGNDTPYDLVACGRRMSSGSAISTDDFKDYGSMNCLDPVIEPTHFDTGYYFLKNNEFYSIQEESEDVKVPAGKAVLYLRQAASSPSYSPIMQLVNTGEVTNINGKEDTDEGDWYDMSGRKLNGRPTKKGVYIQNNKKIVIR